mmetsp:Transcript_6975/g.12432  ORF Transcript_6975/g.12432 Transcript_6975/m.12432 type:complete len:230 (+) Transcript_6975:161-850(+)
MSVTSSTALTSKSSAFTAGKSSAFVGTSWPASFAASCCFFSAASFFFSISTFLLFASDQSRFKAFHSFRSFWNSEDFSLKMSPGVMSSTRVLLFFCVIQSFSFSWQTLSLCQPYSILAKPSSADGKLNFENTLLSNAASTSGIWPFLHHSCFSSSVSVGSSIGSIATSFSSGASSSSTGFPSFFLLAASMAFFRDSIFFLCSSIAIFLCLSVSALDLFSAKIMFWTASL